MVKIDQKSIFGSILGKKPIFLVSIFQIFFFKSLKIAKIGYPPPQKNFFPILYTVIGKVKKIWVPKFTGNALKIFFRKTRIVGSVPGRYRVNGNFKNSF